jgi:hypothetical protein
LGWMAIFGFVLTPIFMQYLLRANHEHPLNVAVVAGIYALTKCQRSSRYVYLFIAALIFAFFIKGLSVVVLSMLSFVYWLTVAPNKKVIRRILAAHGIMLIAIILFELWYRNIAHSNFLLNYLSFQGQRSVTLNFNPLNKIYNFMWYGARILWFSFPWIYFSIFHLFKSGKLGILNNAFYRFLWAGSLSILILFSLSDRKADRYIFTSYLLLSLSGIYILSKIKPRFILWIQSQEKRLPLVLAAGLVFLTFIRIFFHNHYYRFIRFWPD